jgi:cytochrome P450
VIGGAAVVEEVEALLTGEPTLLADPYPLYRRLREQAPVLRTPAGVLVTRWDDVLTALRDPRFTNVKGGSIQDRLELERAMPEQAERIRQYQSWSSHLMSRHDPPAHTALRGLFNRAFTPRRIGALTGAIEASTRELLDRRREEGRLDVVQELAVPLPMRVISELLGIPPEDRHLVYEGSEALAAILGLGYGALPANWDTILRFRSYLLEQIERRRSDPGEDLLSAVVVSEAAGEQPGEVSDETLAALVLHLLFAGHETTTNLIGNTVLELLRHPEQLALVRQDPEGPGRAVEETLRHDAPSQFTHRVIAAPVELGGQQLRPGELVKVVLASANRDPATHADADRFDPRRAEIRHVGFGHGIHFCIGASLARLEARVAVGAILARTEALEPAWDGLDYRTNPMLRGLRSLPVRLN